MNKKVIKTMIWLVIGELIAWYILKIFFPDQFVMAIENENIIKAGQYVDSHKWLLITMACITSFITYWLYLCAVTGKWRLNIREIILIILVVAITQLLFTFDIPFANNITVVAMVFMPFLCKAEYKKVVVVFTVHSFAQLLSISIRDLPSLLTNVNYATIFLMTIECYFWLFLFYLYYNYKEKEV